VGVAHRSNLWRIRRERHNVNSPGALAFDFRVEIRFGRAMKLCERNVQIVEFLTVVKNFAAGALVDDNDVVAFTVASVP
jgi:hypothetical protein